MNFYIFELRALRDLRGKIFASTLWSNLVFRFQLRCRRFVGESQRVVALNPAGWNRRIARAQARERCSFVLSGDEPQDPAGAVEDRIR